MSFFKKLKERIAAQKRAKPFDHPFLRKGGSCQKQRGKDGGKDGAHVRKWPRHSP